MALQNSVAYMKSVHIDSPADPKLPMFVIPTNTLTSGTIVPASAVNSDGTMNFDDLAWWPVVKMTLMYPMTPMLNNYTTQEKLDSVQALLDE